MSSSWRRSQLALAVFFFFQAEDGIRDKLVTGVQTCALPISAIPYPRQGQAKAYRHAGLYAYRVGFLLKISQLEEAPLERIEALEQLRVLWHGYRIAVAVSPREIPPGVDTPRDLEAVRKMLA